jgi:Leucine-rich repeat (LRR) protein
MNKKTIVLFAVVMAIIIGLARCKESPEVVIADPFFEAYCLAHFDKNGNKMVQKKEVESIKSLNVRGLKIQSLKGVEEFLSLEELDCSNNQLMRLYLSQNKKLTTIYCARNELQALDVSDNVNLHTLDCSHNHIVVLNLLNNEMLEVLKCTDNPLIIINVWPGFNLEAYSKWTTPKDVAYRCL